VVWSFVGCGDGPSEDILSRLYGTWQTDAPGYETAQFEIQKDKIVFHTVEDTIEVNRITDIQHTPDDEGDLLTIEYKVRLGDEYLLTVYLYSRPDGDALVFKNQEHITWRKKKTTN
jgi:hypothetical protein